MQLEKVKIKIRCEMGACKNPAAYTVRLARVGIRSRVHICGDCLTELGALAAAETASQNAAPPRSIETLNKSGKNRERRD